MAAWDRGSPVSSDALPRHPDLACYGPVRGDRGNLAPVLVWLRRSSPSTSVQISAWTRKKNALLFVGHLERTHEIVRILVDEKKLGVDIKRGEAWDALSGTSLPVTNHSIELPFAGMSYRMVVLGASRPGG